MPFPSPPWHLRAELCCSLLLVRSSDRGDRAPGMYGAAFVDYREGGVLRYHELLVARLTRRGPAPRIRITDIWVDSPVSRDGGRSLWAIPKELAPMTISDDAGTASSTTCRAPSIASASFTTLPAPVLDRIRTPFAATLSQVRDGGTVVETRMSGTARALPCRGAWEFDVDGPLAWLAGRRSLATFRLTDVRLVFGA